MSKIKALKSAVKMATAPSVVVPSKLTELERMALESKGQYGAKRVQKAADEIKGLEHQFNLQALRDAFLGDNAKALMTMNPADFEQFAWPLKSRYVTEPKSFADKTKMSTEDYVKYLKTLPAGFDDVPFLEINKQEQGLPLIPFISGHEGRHRSRALAGKGEASSLVRLLPRSELRESFPRRNQEEYIQALRDELAMTGNVVLPERYTVPSDSFFNAEIQRPAIAMPDVYAKGGAVGDTKRLIEEAKGSSGRYDPMRAQRVSEYEKGFRDFLAAQQEARESLFKPSPTVGGMAKGAAGALAGYAAQVPGIVGDVLSLYDEFKPERAPNLPEWARALPTTERLQEYYLPENASPELQAGVTGGNLFALGQGVAALPKVVAGGARMAGKGAQALAPTANQMLENYMLKTGQMLPLNVYHGSPHRFAPTPKNPLGEFDPTKIGTGEGAQAYGHGHYLAENPNVANNYRNMLSGTIVKDFEGKIIETGFHNDTARAATFLAENGGDFGKAIKKINDSYPGFAEPVLKKLEYLKNAGAHVEKGSLYKVDLPDEQIAKMLDWDKPLSEQAPEVQKAIKKIPAFNELKKTARLRVPEGRNIDNWSVSFLHKALQDQAGKLNMKPDEIAAALRESGIPGIRYLDQGSRGAGEGTRNFVVFPGGESMLNIISREKKGGMVSEDAMRMKSWDKQIQRKAKGGEVTQTEIDAASKPYRMPAPKRRGSIDASGAKAAGTLLSGIASAVPAGYAGLLELARTRDPKMAADAVEALQERYMSMPEDEKTAKKIERLSGALETLGEPARLVGETTLGATGSPLAATIAELGLDPMNYLPLIGKAPAAARAAKKAAQNLGPVADQMLENYMLRTGMALPVVKRKGEGGNWLTGSVEDALANLKPRAANGVPIEDIVRTHNEMTPGVPMTNANLIRGAAINDWIEKKLTRYIKNEMGTPEDPVRLAADAFPSTKAQMLADKQKQIDKAVADMEKARAVRNFTPEMMTSSQARIRELQKEKELLELRMGLHFGPENVPQMSRMFNMGAAAGNRMGHFPVEGVAKSDLAKFWEESSDARVWPISSSDKVLAGKAVREKNPWLEKLEPNTPVYKFEGESKNVGFDHLIDELRNATNPESGLPRNLLINSKDLPKWTVPQAIEHVDKINAWRAAQKAEADLARASNIATVTHKDYPEQGLRWVELKMPEAAAKEGDIAALAGDDAKRMAALEDAIKYEGEQMNHCVGGYCPAVASGQSRIYSLRDAKGQPHVTIEVEPPSMYPLSGDRLAEQFGDEGRQIFETYRNSPEFSGSLDKFLQERYPHIAERMTSGPPSILQIKGKANKAPKPEYLPFVQDFVRSGQWGDVGDIQNANMVRIYPDSDLAAKMRAAGKEPPTYVSQDEFTQLLKENPMKRGGAVKACDCNDDAIKMAVWDKQIQRKAGGGAVKKMSGGSLVRAGIKTAAKALTSAGKSADELAEVKKVAPEGQQNVQEILEPKSNVFKPKRVQTVSDAQRMAFPGIYQRPDVIAAEAASRVAPENPALKQLFGVTREDLYQLGKSRQGNLPGELPGQAANPRGSAAAEGVMTRRNRQRILDVNAEAEKYPLLVQGMDPWYVMDPLYKRMVELLGPEQANIEYRKMNTLVGMASPGSEVLVEIPRGTAAYYLQKQGRFPEFIEHIGKPEELRKDVPADIVNVPGHVYHRTAQAIPMSKFIESGVIDMTSPKVPMYIEASQVPEIGFQTRTPVGDAHWSRAVGLADTRGARTSKGKEVIPGGSVTNSEMAQLAPWWRERIAKELGIESVPAQARTWGVFSGETGVTTPIGAPKLELMAQKIMETANRLGVSPETARDMVILGETYAGKKKGGKVEKKAEGGLTSDDLILEERKL